MELLTSELISAIAAIVLIDLVLAGDNAIVVGLAASRVHPALRARVIFWGMAGAVLLRVSFAAVATQLLMIVGLTLAGGILLLWVCWKMWRELRTGHEAEQHAAEEALAGEDLDKDGTIASGVPRKTFSQAAWQIVIADVSMSLDNVLAVAGAAREHPYILAFGLLLSIALMGIAASYIARLLQRYRWIAYVGLAIILYVAIKMIYEGWVEVAPLVNGAVG